MMVDSIKLKEKLVDILSWFHKFCVENGLRYYALGGTMLGAMRHGGFIPWDDDVDVGMPRSDYVKFIELMMNSRNDKYKLETPSTLEKDYYYPFCKLYDTTTTLIENTKYKIKRGLYLDIFPLDGFGNTEKEAKKNYNKVKNMDNLLLSKIAGIRKGRKFYKNLAVILFRLVPLNPKKILKKLDKQCAKLNYDKCAFGGNPVGAWRFREIMPTAIMGQPKLYKFENMEIYGAQDADGYLTNLYGDWRKLPPEEKRVTHHDFIYINLNRGYINE